MGVTAPADSARARVPINAPDAILGQEPPLLVFVSAEEQRFGKQIHGRGKGHGRKHASKLLRDHAEFERAEAESAIGFRDRRPQPAQLGHALPKTPVVTRVAIEDCANGSRRTVLGQKLAPLIAQKLLIFGEVEIHRRRSGI